MNACCRIRKLIDEDLVQVLTWRNQPHIRRFMLTQHEISFEEHQHWYDRCSKDATRALLIVEEGRIALGFVHFRGVGIGAIADWGFYAAPGVPKGTGKKIGTSALNYAFQTLEVHKVCGQAFAFNEASIGLHQKMGFRKEGLLRQQHRTSEAYHDIICFGLLRSEWGAQNRGQAQ